MQNNKWVTILVCGIFTVVCGFCALAAPNAAPLARLKSADADGDNKVSFEEFKAAFPKRDRSAFDAHDKNQDGFLSREDFIGSRGEAAGQAAGPRPRMLALLEQADADGDSRVTFEEVSALAPKITRERFARFDRNGDGVISEADLKADRGAGPAVKPDLHAVFKKADKDNNKEVTFEELQSQVPELTKKRFARFDRNGDGVLSQADRPSRAPNGPAADRPNRAAIVQRILRADANGDKKVTYEEVTAKKPGLPRQVFDRLDRNGDGVLSRDDIPEGIEGKE
jgi:Ca2+-binding EF-hand superfamily protein